MNEHHSSTIHPLIRDIQKEIPKWGDTIKLEDFYTVEKDRFINKRTKETFDVLEGGFPIIPNGIDIL